MTTTLKLALRDLLRHRGRSALAILVVALPVAVILTGIIAATTLFYADSSFKDNDPHAIARLTVVPKQDGANEAPQTVAEYSRTLRTTGADVTATSKKRITVRTGDDIAPRRVGWFYHDKSLGSTIKVTSGRAPKTPDEALVTRLGVSQGLPTNGTIEAALDDSYKPLKIVGTAEVRSDFANLSIVLRGNDQTLVHAPSWKHPQDFYFTLRTPPNDQLATVETAITQQLRPAKLNPPATMDWFVAKPPPSKLGLAVLSASLGQIELSLVLATTGLLLALCALGLGVIVAPAFAVAANQQRHTLSLLTQNGATRTRLRRLMATQGFLVGVVGCTLAVAITAGLVSAPVRTYIFHLAGRTPTGLDVPVWLLALVLVISCLSVLLSALITSTRITTAPQKATKPQPPNRFFAVLGVSCVLVAIGITGTWFTNQEPLLYLTMLFTAALGMVLLVPSLLHLGAAVSTVLPTALRFVGRDTARNTHRTSPVVIAIAGATSAFIMVGFTAGSASDYGWTTSNDAKSSTTTQNPMYQVRLQADVRDVNLTSAFQDELASKHPTVQVFSVTEQLLRPTAHDGKSVAYVTSMECAATGNAADAQQECPAKLVSRSYPIVTAKLTDLEQVFTLTEDQKQRIANGAVLAPGSPSSPTSVGLSIPTAEPAAQKGKRVPAIRYPVTNATVHSPIVFMTEKTATKWGFVAGPTHIVARSSSLTELTATAHTATLITPTPLVDFRHGVGSTQPVNWRLLRAIIFGVLIMLIAVLGSVLNFRQSRKQQVVLTAVGSAPRFTRWLAAVQSWWLSALGITIGTVFSALFVSAFLTRWNTPYFWQMHQLTFPWFELTTIWLVVPLLAAAITALFYRPQLPMKRRAS